MSRTEQEIAQDILEKTAVNWSALGSKIVSGVKGAGSAIASKAKGLASNVSHLGNKEYRGIAIKEIAKNPLTIGAGALGVGAVGANMMSKKASDESRIAKQILDQIENG